MRRLTSYILSSSFGKPAAPAVVSLILVAPFMIMELVNRRAFHELFPIPLFAIMWLLAFAFIYILALTARMASSRITRTWSVLCLVANALILVFIGWLWVGIVMDQMPCFLGVQYCD